MGDRSLVVIKSEGNPADIVIYGHWSGEDNLRAVREVLSKTGRVGDPYLVAEIFYEFAVALGGFSGTGYGSFGIWTALDGADEGWIDAPTIYVNQDTGAYTYEGVETTLAELLAESARPTEESNVVYK